MSSFITSHAARWFLDNAAPGAVKTYAIASTLPAHVPQTVTILRAAYNAGHVELTQRRREDGQLDYLMTKRAVVRPVTGCFRFPPAMAGGKINPHSKDY